MAESARYLYVITRGLAPDALAGAVGMDDGRLDVVSHRGLDAVVSDVDLDAFGEEGLRRNLEDLTWLERVARRHDDVVQAVAMLAPAAPLRLATIVMDDDGVRGRIDEWHEAIEAALDRIDGRREWSVKLFSHPTRDQDASAGGSQPEPESGAAYLQRKRQQTQRRAAGEEAARESADRVYDELAKASVASRRLQPQDPRLSGHEGTMVLNAAFLVDDEQASEFQRVIDDVSRGLSEGVLKSAGPWPPYSFATLEPS